MPCIFKLFHYCFLSPTPYLWKLANHFSLGPTHAYLSLFVVVTHLIAPPPEWLSCRWAHSSSTLCSRYSAVECSRLLAMILCREVWKEGEIINPLATRDFVKMAYYSLDVAILLSFWHYSEQYETYIYTPPRKITESKSFSGLLNTLSLSLSHMVHPQIYCIIWNMHYFSMQNPTVDIVRIMHV